MNSSAGDNPPARARTDEWVTASGPELKPEVLHEVLRGHWRLQGRLKPLYAERDLNFEVSNAGKRYLLKVSHPQTQPRQLAFQNRALEHVHGEAPQLPIPRLISDRSGQQQVALRMGRDCYQLRLFSWLPGKALDLAAAPRPAAAAAGAALAELGRALASCPGAGAPTALAWDLQRFGNLAELLAPVSEAFADSEPAMGGMLEDMLRRHAEHIRPALSRLPRQVIHNDLNPDNVLFTGDAARGTLAVSGIIDFGDMVVGPLACDLAIAGAYLVNPGAADPFDRLLAACTAYQHSGPPGAGLCAEALLLLPDLVATRLATTMLIQGYRVAGDQDRDGTLMAGVLRSQASLEVLLKNLEKSGPQSLRSRIKACEGN